MKYRLVIALISCFVFSAGLCRAQATRISGTVTDALTNESIPFANVAFKGTSIGTTTDIDGKYTIETTHPTDSLTASFVGYKPAIIRVVKGKTQVVNFVLKVNKVDLPEIVILPGINPAISLVKNIVENKDKNDKERLDAFQYEVYNKVEFDLTDISEKFKKNRLVKPFAFIFENIDSSATNKKPFLPIFISETLSDYYFKNNPKARKEKIKASKVSGIDNESVTQFLGDMYQNINIYDNFIDLFGKNFVSPISSVGLLYYKYYIVDSAFFSNKWCYKVSYQPRRKQELTFTGDFWVNDTSFAIKKINMRIADDANINFVQDMALIQEYDYTDSRMWMLTKDMLVVELKPTENNKGMGVIGRKTTSYKKFVFNQPPPGNFFANGERVTLVEGASKKDESYWQEVRHDSLSKREQSIYAMVDTIKKLPAFQTYVDIITMFVTGYKEWGWFEIGPYFNIYSFNPVEGNRFRLGGRTGNAFSTNLILSGYLAYGTKDQMFKYGGGVQYFFSKKPRNSVSVSYKNDIEQLGLSENAFQSGNIFASLFRRTASQKLTSIEEKKVFYEMEWIPGFSNRLSFTYHRYAPLGTLDYTYYLNDEKNRVKNVLTTSEITLYTRFAYKENFVAGEVERISLGTKYPILQFNYTVGAKGVVKSDFTYHKITFKIDDTYKMGPFGYLYYLLEGGKTWGTLPYPLLEIHRGNETYTYDYMAFNMMNYYEFVSDKYISFYATQHFDGLFLDKIPLMRKLKWREVVTFKGVVGSMSVANKSILKDSSEIGSLNRKPYMEAGVGVENVLKIVRIDAIWRLSYLNNANIARFGIRGSLQITF